AFGVHRTIDQIGAILGPIAAFSLLQYIDIKSIFLISLIPGGIALLILVFFVKEVAIKRSIVARTTILSNIECVIRGNRPFILLLVITGIFGIGAFNFSFILLRASDLGIPDSVIPLVYGTINVVHTAISIPTGILADKVGKEKVLIIGYSVFAISTALMISISGNIHYAYMLAAIFGLYMGISETTQRAVVPRYVVSELRGTAYGLYNVIIGITFFAANLVFGFLWDNYGLNTAVYYSMFVTIIAICGMLTFIRRYPNSPTQRTAT
ncbi:MAG TPA: MFS transporter, partial [Nitrososphaeraceae archaeon]|nr:MFS transporter [Nitrososphaeraceae archaeon]